MNRRDFIQKTALITGSSMLAPSLFAACSSSSSNILKNKGLQLYTLRDLLAKDFEGTIAAVAEIGYKKLEFFGYEDGKYFGKSIKSIKEILNRYQLSTPSTHLLSGRTMPNTIGTLTNGFDQAVEDALALGQEYIVCAYLFEEERESLDDYKRLAEILNDCGERAKKAGIQLAYHNHDFEFFTIDGVVPYDFLLKECSADLLKFEMDMYWMERAQQDPFSYFEEHSGRFPLWHVKDMDDSEDQFFAPVGRGVIDWKRIFKAADQSGLKHFYVEQDQTKNNTPMEAIKLSYDYLGNLNL